MMYLILTPFRPLVYKPLMNLTEFVSNFTSDMRKVAESLKEPGVKVYKVDSLTEVKDIEVTYQEIVKEMTDE